MKFEMAEIVGFPALESLVMPYMKDGMNIGSGRNFQGSMTTFGPIGTEIKLFI